MARRSMGQLFVGRLSKTARTRDLEEVFENFGRLARCDIKYGAEMAYAFVDFEDRRDAEDAVRKANGREICGSSIVVEWAKGNPRQPLSYDECYKCHRSGHWARDCSEDRQGSRRRSPSPRSSSSRRSGGRRGGGRRSRSLSRDRYFRRSRHTSRSRSRSRSLPYKRPKKSSRRGKSSSYSRSRSRTPKAKSFSPKSRRSPSRSPRARSFSPRSRSSSRS